MKQVDFLVIIFLSMILVVSCSQNTHGKRTSGVYKVDFRGLKTVDFKGKGLDTVFTDEQKLYYSNFYLYINSDRTFHFSKSFFNEKDTINGSWEVHDDPLAFTILLNGKRKSYYSHMAMCETINAFVDVAVPNEHYLRRLPFIKIKHEFPEMINVLD